MSLVVWHLGFKQLTRIIIAVKAWSIFLLSIYCLMGHAQNSDALRQRIKDMAPDTVKANLLMKLALQVSPTNKDSALYYLDASLMLSEKLDYTFGLMKGNWETGKMMEWQNKSKARDYFVAALPFAQQLATARISKIASIIKTMLLGYARHPACGQKIYRAYNQYMPGKCARCGAGIHTNCFQPQDLQQNQCE